LTDSILTNELGCCYDSYFNSKTWSICNDNNLFYNKDTVRIYNIEPKYYYTFSKNNYYPLPHCCSFITWTFQKDNGLYFSSDTINNCFEEKDHFVFNNPHRIEIKKISDKYFLDIFEVLSLYNKKRMKEKNVNKCRYKVVGLKDIQFLESGGFGHICKELTIVRLK
jgi:hypothetical protein